MIMLVGWSYVTYAQMHTSLIQSLEGEKWWGAFVAKGNQMPYLHETDELDLSHQNFNNQGVPLLLSNKGRYIWSDEAFRFEINAAGVAITSAYEKIEAVEAGKNLRDAYLAACKKHFPPTGKLPDPLLFSMPQYNTWIELMYNQNQADILKYADNIIKHDFPKGEIGRAHV